MSSLNEDTRFIKQTNLTNGGLNVSLPNTDIADNELVDALNVEVIGRSRVMTRFGYTELGTATGIGAGKIQGLLTYYKTTGTAKDHLLIFTEGDDGAGKNIFSYRTDNTTWSTGALGDIGTTGQRARGAVLNDYAVFGNGVAANTLQKFDGTTVTNVTTDPVDGNVFTVMAGQMYALVPAVPSTVYRCDTENPDAWSGGAADAINVEKTDGSICKGLFANQDRVNVLKEQSKHVISLLFDDTAAIVASQVKPFRDRSGGCIMPDSVQEVYSDIYTLAELDKGIQKFGEIEQFQGGNPRSTCVSVRVNPIIANFNRSKVEDGAAKFYQNRYYLSVPYGLAQVNNYCLVYNWEFDNFTTYNDWPASCYEVFRNANKENNLVFGSASQPKLYELNKRFDDDGGGYVRRIKTKVYNDGDPWLLKYFRFFDIKGAMAYSTELTIKVYIDEQLAFEKTIDKDTEEVQFITAPTDEGIVGYDYLGNEFVGGASPLGQETPFFPFTARIDIPLEHRRGRSIQVSFESDEPSHGWSLDFPYARIAYDPLSPEIEM